MNVDHVKLTFRVFVTIVLIAVAKFVGLTPVQAQSRGDPYADRARHSRIKPSQLLTVMPERLFTY